MGINGKLIIIVFWYLMMVQTASCYSEKRCKEACSRSIVDEEVKVCAMCVNIVPINFLYCEDACVKEIEPICDRCRDNFLQFVSGETCIYACETQNSFWMQIICIRCKRIPPKSALLCDYACKAKDNYYFTRICYWCQNNKS